MLVRHFSYHHNSSATFGHDDCAEALLDAGADLESQSIDAINYVSRIPIYTGGGRTPLMRAVIAHNPETVELLLKRGAEATRIKDLDGRSAYDLACRQKGTPLAHLLCPEKNTVPNHPTLTNK